MAEIPVFAQLDVPATTLSDVYEVPADKQAVLSSINLCNRSTAEVLFRVAIAPNGDSDDPSHYLAYDAPVQAKRTASLFVGPTLPEAAVVRVYTSAADVTVTIFGTEQDVQPV